MRNCFLIPLTVAMLCCLNVQVFGQEKQEKTVEQNEDQFLQSLVGTWQMKGRFRPTEETPWIPTSSKMVAKLRLSDQAIVREIEAPQINLKAIDIIWYDKSKKEYTYIYLNSLSPSPVIMSGTMTAKNEVTFQSISEKYKTIIRLDAPDKMIAQDFIPNSTGGEFLKRDINHTKVK